MKRDAALTRDATRANPTSASAKHAGKKQLSYVLSVPEGLQLS